MATPRGYEHCVRGHLVAIWQGADGKCLECVTIESRERLAKKRETRTGAAWWWPSRIVALAIGWVLHGWWIALDFETAAMDVDILGYTAWALLVVFAGWMVAFYFLVVRPDR